MPNDSTLLSAALASQDGLALVDRHGAHIAATPAYAALFGREASTVPGLGLAALWGDAAVAAAIRPCLDHCLDGEPARCGVCPPGQDAVTVELVFSPVRDTAGRVETMAVAARDITTHHAERMRLVRVLDQKRVEHLKAAAAVDELTRERAAILASLPVGVLLADRNLRLAEVNDAMLTLCGLRPERPCGTDGAPLSPGEGLRALAALDCPCHDLMRDAFISRKPVGPATVACPQGGAQCILAATPFLDAHGRCTGVVLTAQAG